MSDSEWAEKFGRWIEEDEIVIEDLSEAELSSIAHDLAKAGYRCEYWKAEKQESGHLHIKNIEIKSGPTVLWGNQLNKYKELFMRKYVPESLWDKVDWSFVNAKRHRIAEENKEHFKGYGIKKLVTVVGEGNENKLEKELYFKATNMPVEKEETKYSEDTCELVKKVKITEVAESYGLQVRNGKTVCPFHNDSDPSMSLNNEIGSFYCFGCYEKGGIYKFVQKLEELKRKGMLNGSNNRRS